MWVVTHTAVKPYRRTDRTVRDVGCTARGHGTCVPAAFCQYGRCRDAKSVKRGYTLGKKNLSKICRVEPKYDRKNLRRLGKKSSGLCQGARYWDYRALPIGATHSAPM